MATAMNIHEPLLHTIVDLQQKEAQTRGVSVLFVENGVQGAGFYDIK